MLRCCQAFLLSFIFMAPYAFADEAATLPADGVEAEWRSQTPEGQGYWKDGVWVDLSPEPNENGYWQNGVWVSNEPSKAGSGYFDPNDSSPID